MEENHTMSWSIKMFHYIVPSPSTALVKMLNTLAEQDMNNTSSEQEQKGRLHTPCPKQWQQAIHMTKQISNMRGFSVLWELTEKQRV